MREKGEASTLMSGERRNMQIKTGKESKYKAQKTTEEIRELLSNANLDFNTVVNEALNSYLPKIFHSCPFTEDICTTKQCLDCSVSKGEYRQNLPMKIPKIKPKMV